MTQPFVVSMKYVSDPAQAVAANDRVRNSFIQIGRSADDARGRVGQLGNTLALQPRGVSAASINAAVGVRDEFDTSRRQAEIEAYGRELDELRAKFNPLFAAEQRYLAITAEISRAKRVGALTAMEADDALLREKAAYDQLTGSIAANSNARLKNQGAAAGNFNSANVAAQFQDILVTSQMGMSPLQIALQQGTQLSAVLGASGAAGAAGVLRGALFSLINPVSLITIGVVGVGVAALQAFGGMMAGAEDATDALEEHEKWLDKILVGYDGARQAAKDAAEEASKLPRGVVQQELSDRRDSLNTQVAAQLAVVITRQRDLNDLTAQWKTLRAESARLFPDDQVRLDRFDALIAEAEQLRQVQVNANSSRAELEGVMELTRRLMSEAREPAVRALATDVYNLAVQLSALQAQLDATTAAQQSFNANAFRGLGVSDAVEQIRQMTPELRSAREIVNDIFTTNAGQARTTSELQGLADAAKEFNAAMDAKDAAEAAEKAERETARLAAQRSEYDRAIESIRDRTQAQQTETNVIGLSTYAAERYRVQLELENAARKDAIGLTPERIAQIEQESAAYARAAAEQEAVLKVERERTEQLEFAKGAWRSFWTEAFGNLRKGEEGWKAFANAGTNALNRIADRALGMAADGIFDLIVGALTRGGGGSAYRGGWGSTASFLAGHARGTSNFPGGWTRINEEGGEIVNLPRGSQIIPHDVSMAAARGGSGGAGGFTYNDNRSYSFAADVDEGRLRQILAEDRAALRRELPQAVRFLAANPRREALPG